MELYIPMALQVILAATCGHTTSIECFTLVHQQVKVKAEVQEEKEYISMASFFHNRPSIGRPIPSKSHLQPAENTDDWMPTRPNIFCKANSCSHSTDCKGEAETGHVDEKSDISAKYQLLLSSGKKATSNSNCKNVAAHEK